MNIVIQAETWWYFRVFLFCFTFCFTLVLSYLYMSTTNQTLPDRWIFAVIALLSVVATFGYGIGLLDSSPLVIKL